MKADSKKKVEETELQEQEQQDELAQALAAAGKSETFIYCLVLTY